MTAALMPVLTGSRPTLVEFDAPAGQLNPLKANSEDVRRWIEGRSPRPSTHWNQIGSQEMTRAFTAAQTTGAGIIDDLYLAFYKTIAEGGTEVDFEAEVMPILKAKGWLADKGDAFLANRIRLIYDTNLRLARASGRWARYWSSRSALPYLRGVTGRDDRVRHPPKSPSDHTAWEGIILPIEHEFWTRWFPPLGFRCRCNTIQMTRSQIARFDGGVTSEAELARRERLLGDPIFAAPGAPIEVALAGMVRASNVDNVPGRPSIDPRAMQQQGARLWDSMQTEQQVADLDRVLARIFG